MQTCLSLLEDHRVKPSQLCGPFSTSVMFSLPLVTAAMIDIHSCKAMGYASHLAVKAFDASISPSAQDDLQLGLTLYYAQLAMNFAWTPLFFNSKRALFDKHTNGQTTYFLLPYCLWLTYATYLNGGIWWLNKGKPKHE
ncbi:hypothetical protein D9758_008868 [Tetrapyrgos nigripes]|uniref:Uncharacterized protein n=1 Tax=Tetrapyrgos nigripes TaxID=182062 RepID=A0A8H5CMN7_9AGAR|nr:hypothetical protein D9758_008868 [Tetrapyrgos nigripes]